jgi:hypothetical protein
MTFAPAMFYGEDVGPRASEQVVGFAPSEEEVISSLTEQHVRALAAV